MRYSGLFKKIKEIQSGNFQGSRRIIDIETLETYRTCDECGNKIGCSGACVYQGIITQGMSKGHRLEFFDEWQSWLDKEKEKYTRKNNIYFLRGAKL